MAILILLCVVVAAMFILAWPFMWIWNYAVVAAISVTNPIDYWIAFWLMLFITTFITAKYPGKKE